MAKQCQICGKNSGMYPLCTEHFHMRDEGLVAKCEHCGKWYLTEEGCECQRPKFTELPLEGFDTCVVCGASTNGKAFCYSCWRERNEEEMLEILNSGEYYEPDEDEDESAEVEVVAEHDEVTIQEEIEEGTIEINPRNRCQCITCGKQTNGLLFCESCLDKYENKELLFKIVHCSKITLLDESYEGLYQCEDGHIVKSKSEREIDDYLFRHNILHCYEPEVPYGLEASEVIHPDFCLPGFLPTGEDVYIEHWGYDKSHTKYQQQKQFKLEIYRQLGCTLVCIHEATDAKKINAVLRRKLNPTQIIPSQINFEEN